MRLLDLGCGDGRVLAPLARAGHRMVGVDREPAALAACRRRVGPVAHRVTLVQRDFTCRWPRWPHPFDGVLCLGNTFMAVWDVSEAVRLLRRVRRVLRPGGVFVLDDFVHEFWPELTGGNWQEGVSRDGSMQLVWASGDSVFALRSGKAVDRRSTRPKPGDVLFRLWSLGAIALAARAAGLSGPQRVDRSGLLILRRPGPKLR